ncbi:MAG: DUF1614 domain-containing protein [Candidatus Nezhaarchaeota archaeon]|nr:DUF1614 domain-containing protein [Candidatus Nezhaarchaeota archaeon]MCX8142543.1 DUF1614 domain-containing protein [Candidatus Nezhaarchaeota archaeon]
MKRKVILQLPSHPMLMFLLVLLALTPLIWLYFIPQALAQAFQPLGLSPPVSYAIALVMILLSILFSFVNIAVVEIPRRTIMPEIKVEMRYVYFFGIPYPVPRIRFVVPKMVIGVNVGGAVIPILISTLMLSLMALSNDPHRSTLVFLGVMAIVSLISHVTSRIIPGVGIVVPALVPPLIAALSTILLASLINVMEFAPAIAYSGAVIGTLIGADIVNLIRHLDKLQSPLVSIGGAGTFDGIYLSGIMALLLTLLFI